MFNAGDRVERRDSLGRYMYTATVVGRCTHGANAWFQVLSDDGGKRCCSQRRLHKIEKEELKVDYTQGF